MWWECSECGSNVERARAPAVCRDCGTAGVIFAPVGNHEPIGGDPDVDSLRAVWLRAGFEHADTIRAA